MRILSSLSDETVLVEMGKRIAQSRLDQQWTQQKLAEQAGISKRTLERVEAGASAQMLSVIRILRVLNLLDNLDLLLPQASVSPMDYLRMKGKKRQRASSRIGVKEPLGEWSWDDEKS